MSANTTNFADKMRGGKGNMNLLEDYLKDTFRKIDRANSNFCTTLESDWLSKRIAKTLHLRKEKVQDLLSHVTHEQEQEKDQKN